MRAHVAFLTAAIPIAACVPPLPDETNGTGFPNFMVALVSSAGSPANLAVDSQSVYWADISRQAVMKVSPRGIETVARTPFRGYYQVAVDARSVYWTSGQQDFARNEIVKVDIAGGQPTTIVADPNDTDDIEIFAVRGGAIYWTTGGGNVKKASLGGGPPTVLATEQWSHVGLAVDGTSAYWIRSDGIVKVGISGGEPVLIAPMLTESYSNLAVDATHVYWSDALTNKLLKVPIGGGTPEVAYAPGSEPMHVAADGSGLYWIDQSGSVWGLDRPQTEARALGVTAPDGVGDLVLDETGVFWVAGDAIYRTPK